MNLESIITNTFLKIIENDQTFMVHIIVGIFLLIFVNISKIYKFLGSETKEIFQFSKLSKYPEIVLQ